MANPFFTIRECCPACKSTKYQEVYSASYNEPPVSKYLEEFYFSQGKIEFEYLYDLIFILDECKECGLIYQRLVPNDLLSVKLYEEWIDPQINLARTKEHEMEYYKTISRQIEKVIDYLGVVPGKLEILDFGMGSGQWCRMAGAYGCVAVSSEISQTRIEHAKSGGVKVVNWNDIPNYQFDFINTNQVFEHLTNPLEILVYLCHSLKPEGIIKISVPDGSDIKRRLEINDWTAPKGSQNSLNPIAPLEHLNCFSYTSLVYMAEIAGLVPVEIQGKTTPSRKNLIDLNLRDVLRPFYKRLFKESPESKKTGTSLFFKRRMPVKI